MVAQSYKRRIDFALKPAVVFRALTKDVDMWWTISSDDASVIGSIATFRFDESHNTMLIRDFVPERRVVWYCVVQNHADKTLWAFDEWMGTRLLCDIEPYSRGSRLSFVHQGVVPQLEGYAA